MNTWDKLSPEQQDTFRSLVRQLYIDFHGWTINGPWTCPYEGWEDRLNQLWSMVQMAGYNDESESVELP